MPNTKGQGSFCHPPAGGCSTKAYRALITGAPAKTMDITTAGVPLAPKASSTLNAPAAPAIPATSDQPIPLAVKLHEAPLISSTAKGASSAVRKYAKPTQRKAL